MFDLTKKLVRERWENGYYSQAASNGEDVVIVDIDYGTDDYAVGFYVWREIDVEHQIWFRRKMFYCADKSESYIRLFGRRMKLNEFITWNL